MRFNEKLKYLREKKGYTQEDVASRVNVARQSVSKWEQGINEPDIDTLKKLCQIFDCSIEELIDDDKEVTPTSSERTNHMVRWLSHLCIIFTVFFETCLLAIVFASKETIITTWNHLGEASYGSKWFLLLDSLILLIGLLLFLLLSFLSKKNKAIGKYSLIYMWLSLIVTLGIGLTVIVLGFIRAEIGASITPSLVSCCVLGLIVAMAPFTHPRFNGRNPLFGVRTNLTLSSEEAWKRVNSFASIVLTSFALIGYILNLVFVKNPWGTAFLSMTVFALIPVLIKHHLVAKDIKC